MAHPRGCVEGLRSTAHSRGESSSHLEHYYLGLKIVLEMSETIAFPEAQASEGLRTADLFRSQAQLLR